MAVENMPIRFNKSRRLDELAQTGQFGATSPTKQRTRKRALIGGSGATTRLGSGCGMSFQCPLSNLGTTTDYGRHWQDPAPSTPPTAARASGSPLQYAKPALGRQDNQQPTGRTANSARPQPISAQSRHARRIRRLARDV
jgi:hypothetical protein